MSLFPWVKLWRHLTCFLPCINQKNQSNGLLECVWSLAKYTSLLIWTSKLIMGPKDGRLQQIEHIFFSFLLFINGLTNVNSFIFFYIKFLCSSNKNFVITLTLGSWPRQGHAKVRTKKEAWESHLMLMGM
jgi:hypothetical protein